MGKLKLFVNKNLVSQSAGSKSIKRVYDVMEMRRIGSGYPLFNPEFIGIWRFFGNQVGAGDLEPLGISFCD